MNKPEETDTNQRPDFPVELLVGPDLMLPAATWPWITAYAGVGSMCRACPYSENLWGGGHACRVIIGESSGGRLLDATDCPALPDEYYPPTPNAA